MTNDRKHGTLISKTETFLFHHYSYGVKNSVGKTASCFIPSYLAKQKYNGLRNKSLLALMHSQETEKR
jgi:hypothetical protein